jgi:hypothetical protein
MRFIKNRFSSQRAVKLSAVDLSVTPIDSHDFGPCECCGNFSRTVWGSIYHSQEMIAVYYVQWTLNNPEHGANFDLITGKWGDGTVAQDRQAVSLAYRAVEASFMVIDAEHRPVAKENLAGTALKRSEVSGTKIAENAFAIVDAIWLQDERIDEVRRWS